MAGSHDRVTNSVRDGRLRDQDRPIRAELYLNSRRPYEVSGMRVAIRWLIAIAGTVATFGLATWVSALAGTTEGWALGIGALAAALMLAVLQTWATTPGQPVEPTRPRIEAASPIPASTPAPEALRNEISAFVDGEGSVIQAQRIRDVHIHAPAASAPASSANTEPQLPIRVGDVPQRPPAFQPRTDLFEQITAANPVTVVQALTGARGVGKTQLAAEYARQCIDERRPLVAWIPAEEPGQAEAGLTELAEALGLRYAGEDAASAVRKVRHWLESPEAEGSLVVFDNAVKVETLRPLLPAAGPARIIITSNYHSFEDLGTTINVDVFSPAEAMEFLRARIDSDDEAGAKRLAAEVDRLPLALAQSAGVIRQDGLS